MTHRFTIVIRITGPALWPRAAGTRCLSYRTALIFPWP